MTIKVILRFDRKIILQIAHTSPKSFSHFIVTESIYYFKKDTLRCTKNVKTSLTWYIGWWKLRAQTNFS